MKKKKKKKRASLAIKRWELSEGRKMRVCSLRLMLEMRWWLIF
jgi:hypothetical protein